MTKPKEITEEDIKNINWGQSENFALIDTRNKRVLETSDTKEYLDDVLVVMGKDHPLYPFLLLVEKPITENDLQKE